MKLMNPSLIKYIQQAHAQGMSPEEIKMVLKKSGWSESEINQAFENLRTQVKPEPALVTQVSPIEQNTPAYVLPTSSNYPNKDNNSIKILIVIIGVILISGIGIVAAGIYLINQFMQNSSFVIPTIAPTKIPVPMKNIFTQPTIEVFEVTPTLSPNNAPTIMPTVTTLIPTSIPPTSIPNNPTAANTPTPIANNNFVSQGQKVVEPGVNANAISATENTDTMLVTVVLTNTSTTTQDFTIGRLSMLSQTHGTSNISGVFYITLAAGESRTMQLEYNKIPNPPFRFVYTTLDGTMFELGTYTP